MTKTLNTEELGLLFENAHTTHLFTDEPVTRDQIEAVYNDIRWAPTALNAQPLRLTLVGKGEARDRLVSHMAAPNAEKTAAAPLCIIASYDPRWHEHMPHLAPQREGFVEQWEPNDEGRNALGRSSALIQIGYLLLALRAHGLESGPMTGLDMAGVDAEFHTENGWKTLAVINVGHAPSDLDGAQRPRAGRLTFEQASQII